MAMSFDSLRVGKRYVLKNLGEKNEFQVHEKTDNNEFIVKDTNSLELYNLTDLIKYGKGKDYDLYEAD